MRSLLILCVAALAGCGTWSKPGGTLAMLEADKQECGEIAAKDNPPHIIAEPTLPTVANRKCSSIYGESQCIPFGADQGGAQTDLNAGARSAAFDRCLANKGYTFSSK